MRMSIIAFAAIAVAFTFALAYAQGDKDKHGLTTEPSAAIRICTVGSHCAVKASDIPTSAPRPEDVASIDGMIKAWYDIVTVPKGKAPDWARDHTLYIRDIRFVEMREKDGQPVPHIVSHQQFADESSPIADEGFSEREIHRVTARFGNI